MNQTATATAAITQSQLACLGGVSPSFVSVHLDELPESFFLRNGSNGRPPRCWTVEQIAELILDRTGFLTEAECRLRVALQSHTASRRPKPAAPRIVDRDHGESFVVPSDLTDLPADVRELFDRATADDLSRLRTSRAKRIATHAPTEE
jgi:hypothetical protein